MSVYENLTNRIETEQRCALDCIRNDRAILAPLFLDNVDELKNMRDSMLLEEAILQA